MNYRANLKATDGNEKYRKILKKKGRTWGIFANMPDKIEKVVNWDFYKSQTEECINIIKENKHKLQLIELAKVVRLVGGDRDGKVFSFEMGGGCGGLIRNKEDEEYLNMCVYKMNIEDTEEYLEDFTKHTEHRQKFWTYMYNEYPIEKVAKYKKKVTDWYEKDMERTFEEKERKVIYYTTMSDGNDEYISGEQGYINTMNSIKANREQIIGCFNQYVKGVSTNGRKQRGGK